MSSETQVPWAGFPIIPVVVIHDARQAPRIADALVAGGIGIIEVALRSDAALSAIETLAGRSDLVVAAGTLTRASHAPQVRDAGARFALTPGYTEDILDALDALGMPVIPGAMTLSEILRLRERGVTDIKVFPVDALGGPSYLHAVHSVVPEVRLYPSGGVRHENLADYLSHPACPGVMGSWIAPHSLVEQQSFEEITRIAQAAMAVASDYA